MAEENVESKEEATKPKAKSSFLPMVLVPGLAFVASVAFFSWQMGVFSDAPPESGEGEVVASATESGQKDDLAAADTTATEEPVTESPLDGTLMELATSNPTSVQSSAEESQWLAHEREKLQRESAALDAKKRELQLLKQDIEKLLTQVQDAKSERLKMMAKLYDNMESEAVAKQISNMDDRTVVRLLPHMNTRTAAKIMALLEPKRAAQIATKLMALEK